MSDIGNRPALSVVVAATQGPQAVRRLLADLATQRDVLAPEIIVVDGTGRVTAQDLAVGDALPAQLLAAPGADVSVLRAVGAHGARGELVAFTEDHCRLPVDWCAALLRNRAAGHQAFGGAIDIGSFRAPPDWAAFLVEFSAFMPPLAPGATDVLPGMNAAYDRALLEGVLDEALCEPVVNGRLQAQGVTLYSERDQIVTFERHFGVGAFVRHCYASGRMFGGLRLAHATSPSRVAYALGAVTMLPALLVLRIGVRVFARRRARRAFALALPWIALYAMAWGVGEAAGAFAVGGAPAPARSRAAL